MQVKGVWNPTQDSPRTLPNLALNADGWQTALGFSTGVPKRRARASSGYAEADRREADVQRMRARADGRTEGEDRLNQEG